MSNETHPHAMEPDDGAAAPEDPIANGYTADAQERMTRLRVMATEFPDDVNPRPLTSAEMRLARVTTLTALEKAALFVEAAPGIGGSVANAASLRDAIAFELAYDGLRNEALAMARRVDHAILRRKLKAVLATRGLYRVAKGFVTVDAGDGVRPHLDAMKRALVRPPRPKPQEPPPVEPPATAITTGGKKPSVKK
jgi:hypothetical protein